MGAETPIRQSFSSDLATVCNYQHGTSYVECFGEAHRAVVSAVERAAAAMGATMAGVDITSPDMRKPEYVVNEVNTTSGLPMHYAAPNHLDLISTFLRQHFDLPAPVHSERERRSS